MTNSQIVREYLKAVKVMDIETIERLALENNELVNILIENYENLAIHINKCGTYYNKREVEVLRVLNNGKAVDGRNKIVRNLNTILDGWETHMRGFTL